MEDLKRILAEIEVDYVKFMEKGNKAAGTRVRTKSMEYIKAIRAFRLSVLEQAQAMATNA